MIGYKTEDDTSKLDGWIRYDFVHDKGFNLCFYVENAGYYDERPLIHTSVTQLIVLFSLPILLTFSPWFLFLLPLVLIGWGKLYINLPIKTNIQDCESAAWGFNYHDNTIWIYIGGGGDYKGGGRKYKTIEMPWMFCWYRTSLLLNNGEWEHEYAGNRKNFYEDKWSNIKWQIKATYLDKYDNSIIESTIHMEEREWRRKWLKKTKLFNSVSRTISVKFDKEVGSRKGTYKGGTTGASYKILPGEDIMDCLERLGFTSISYQRDRKLSQIMDLD